MDDVTFKNKKMHRITNYNMIGDFALSDDGRKAFAGFVSDRHWDEFLEWYEDQFGEMPPGVEAYEAYVPVGRR